MVEIVGNIGADAPLQMAAIVEKVGITIGFADTLNVATLAHCPAFGVKVYVADVVLLTVAGSHVPAIPLVDVVGKIGANAPLQNAAMGKNVGAIIGFTIMLILAVLAHCPAFGVKV